LKIVDNDGEVNIDDDVDDDDDAIYESPE